MSVQEDNLLTRYITAKRFFDISSRTVEPNAFLPKGGETSLANITNLESAEDIWAYADNQVARKPPGARARADVLALDIYSSGLGLSADAPPSIHVNIVEWPDSESECLLMAEEIASASSLVPRPPRIMHSKIKQ